MCAWKRREHYGEDQAEDWRVRPRGSYSNVCVPGDELIYVLLFPIMVLFLFLLLALIPLLPFSSMVLFFFVFFFLQKRLQLEKLELHVLLTRMTSLMIELKQGLCLPNYRSKFLAINFKCLNMCLLAWDDNAKERKK